MKDGGPAYPVDYDHHTFKPKNEDEAKRLMSGMSLRDYFAAKAMHQFLSGAVFPQGHDHTDDLESFGNLAYQAADAMLAAKQKGQT